MQSRLLPLFPLNVVIFPRTELPLHIFEERYKEMVGEAIRENSEFGIVLARGEGIVNTGCTVVVEKVLKRHPDGRLDIMTRGSRRFEVVSLNDEKSYLRGEVEFFDDDEPGPGPAELQQRALAQFESLAEFGIEGMASPAVDDPQLSFQLAQAVPDLDFRQTLLSSRSERERLKQLTAFLADFVPRQRLILRMRQLAPLNGHGPHSPGPGSQREEAG
ncbi:MAG: LON peptidase substrate-binding domain-containing protein [Bryobacterales bacterium]|nr:LON peptidase substrate-binding domain-containing protein [Bryobacterales bacterium]